MKLENEIKEIRNAIKNGHFENEAAVSQGVVLRLLNALNWPTYDTQTVWPEYNLGGKRVDYALCHPKSKPIIFIEVKNIGHNDGAERQLFNYAFHKGVPFAILTDGQEWNFFLPAEQGDYTERRVYKLDIIERDLDECTFRLDRYLEYSKLTSGVAIKDAREDYRDVSRERQIQDTLPQAWTQLIKNEDEILMELIADQVEDICGFKPDNNTVASFINNNFGTPVPKHQKTMTKDHKPKVSTVSDGFHPKVYGFTIDGTHYTAQNSVDLLAKIFEVLTVRDPSFPNRFSSLPKHGRKRRYLADNPNKLYPDRPDLADAYSRQLESGWWIPTNNSLVSTRRIISMACDVASIQYDDLQVKLGG